MRNTLLEILYKLLTVQAKNGISTAVSEEIQRVLGFDWLMLFLQWHIHRSTVVIVMRILGVILSNPAAMTRFREGSVGGGWLAETECVLENRIGQALGLNLNQQKVDNHIHREICQVSYFSLI